MAESHFKAVRDFHAAVGAPGPAVPAAPDAETVALRRTLLGEEYGELIRALDSGDLAAIAGEAADLLYVTYGLCVAYGIDADAVFAAVHQANMAKTAGPRRPDGKQLKPADWQPADVAGVLERQRAASEPAAPIEMAAGGLRVEIIFDGGADPNPGRGYGSYRLTVNGKPRAVKRLAFPGTMTNNEAEYNTLIGALEEIHAHSRDLARTTVAINGDSSLVINQINGAWKAKDARMAALRDRALALLAPLQGWSATWHGRSNSVRVLGH
ncbi:MAG TPA: reverse transcriptase-like protein [Herpetosiphonaceae bacterium]|nr:reverse transcriptase-like protein [Herpetosiphonaceae bacterium]